MIIKEFSGYREGADLTKIPAQNLAFPSKDVLVNKGKIYTREGLVNDGVVATVQEAIHSEFVWKDAAGGQRPIRVHGNTVQVKYNKLWYTIFTGIDSSTTRVFFATWVDINSSITKKRLFFVDGTTAIYQWNGAIEDVASATSNTVVLDTTKTCLQIGFDDGSGTAQTILHFIGTAVVANSEESQNNDPTAQTLNISGTFDTTPVADDVIIAKPVKFANEIASTYDIDAIYSFQNHIVVASYNSVDMHFSHVATYSLSTGLDFTQPVAGSRTALTPILLVLDGNFTAMISRKDDDPTIKNVLWISDADDWYKITKSVEQNPYDLWVEVNKYETGGNKGALPMAAAKYKGDILYMAQDNTLNRVRTLEITARDDIQLVSDDVEALLQRVDMTDVRLYYLERAIYIICPVDSTLIILDMVEGYFQPPQIMPLNCISVIDGVRFGHHNAENQTFTLFSGRNDLDAPIESKIAFGLWHGDHPLRYKQHTIFGMSTRLNVNTEVELKHEYEETGSKQESTVTFKGSEVETYAVSEDDGWAQHPYATRSRAGVDMAVTELRRAVLFDKENATSYFDFRPIFTISGTENEFHLLAIWWDDRPSPRKIGNNLFIAK
ncbi:MAG: hypothetical protein FVQ79_03355 [Planctomycetes bacterium]|nr:hypothetical protein [Planctomycetota bacterium]